MNSNDDSITISGPVFYNYTVGFIDILGQRALLGNQWLLPNMNTPGVEQDFQQLAHNTVSTIIKLRAKADRFVDGMDSQPLQDHIQNSPHRAAVERYKKMHIYKANMADGFLLYSPSSKEDIPAPMIGVLGILSALGVMMFTAPGLEVALRGGIDFAWASEIAPGEIYGAAPYGAYKLESESALYPRIVLSDRMVSLIRNSERIRPNEQDNNVNLAIAKQCQQAIAVDTDGKTIVHYLGPDFPARGDWEGYQKAYELGLQFINESLDLWTRSGNTRIKEKYEYLKNYYTAWPPKQPETI